jgi:chromosome segregation ATPase
MLEGELPPRQRPKIVDDELRPTRLKLKEAAEELEKYVHFEGAIKGDLSKIAKDIDDLARQFDEIEAQIAKHKKDIEKEKTQSQQDTELPPDAKNAKIQRIKELEEQFQRLLAEKASYLRHAKCT